MSEPDDDYDPLCWWSISGTGLLHLLRRVADGEDPDMVYAEEYANGDRDIITPLYKDTP
jgi:hypothetical protein